MTQQSEWESQFKAWLLASDDGDAAHGLQHIERVVANVRRLARGTSADMRIILPAAWLHDCVNVPKDSPLRSQASRLSAEKAAAFLREIGYEEALIEPISHAIEAHSFSAEITPTTLEAKLVQDADRLDAIGAIGIARCLQIGTNLGRPLYNSAEPFPIDRPADDAVSSIDHFYTKLLKLAGTMQTEAGRIEATQRTQFMQQYLEQLALELSP